MLYVLIISTIYFRICRRCRSRLRAARVEATATYRAPCVTAARSRYVATTSPRSSRRYAASFVMKTDSSNVINVTVRSRTRDTDTRTRGGSRTSQREGREPHRDGCQPIIWPRIPENCVKMRKIIPRKGIRHCVSYILHDLTPINRSLLYY